MPTVGGSKKGKRDPQPSGGSGSSDPYTMESLRKDRQRNEGEKKKFDDFVEEHEVGKRDDDGETSR